MAPAMARASVGGGALVPDRAPRGRPSPLCCFWAGRPATPDDPDAAARGAEQQQHKQTGRERIEGGA
jgi:hypothetical protein